MLPSIVKAYSGARSGFGTITAPGSLSNTLPMSSMFGARNPVLRSRPSFQPSPGRQVTPRFPVRALLSKLVLVAGYGNSVVSKAASSADRLKRAPAESVVRSFRSCITPA